MPSDLIVQALTPIAQGEKAQDPHGFSREYAVRALRRLGANMALPARKGELPRTKDLLAWFPGDVKVVGAALIATAADPASGTRDDGDLSVEETHGSRSTTERAGERGRAQWEPSSFGESQRPARTRGHRAGAMVPSWR